MPVGISRPVLGHLIIPMPTRTSRVCVFVPWQRVRSPSAGLHLFSREALVPADPGGLQKFDSGGFLQDSGEALLDRLGRLGCDFLSELPKFPVLRGRCFEVLAALRG